MTPFGQSLKARKPLPLLVIPALRAVLVFVKLEGAVGDRRLPLPLQMTMPAPSELKVIVRPPAMNFQPLTVVKDA
jgi:hypothetical protein